MSKSDMPLCQLWCLVTGLNLVQVFLRFLGQHTLIASTIDCQLSLEYNEPIRTQFTVGQISSVGQFTNINLNLSFSMYKLFM